MNEFQNDPNTLTDDILVLSPIIIVGLSLLFLLLGSVYVPSDRFDRFMGALTSISSFAVGGGSVGSFAFKKSKMLDKKSSIGTPQPTVSPPSLDNTKDEGIVR